MALATGATRLTYRDYCSLPDDGRRHEIFDGELVTTDPPDLRHQRILVNLSLLLAPYARKALAELLAAPLDVVLSDHDVVQPDLVYVSRENARIVREENLQGPPDLVVEITAEATRQRDFRLKRALYERSGVREYWIVDPEADEVTVYRRRGSILAREAQVSPEAGDRISSPLLPGLEIPLSVLFE
jgi:Uma2 family endonuclease